MTALARSVGRQIAPLLPTSTPPGSPFNNFDQSTAGPPPSHAVRFSLPNAPNNLPTNVSAVPKGPHNLLIAAGDNAGNSATDSVPFHLASFNASVGPAQPPDGGAPAGSAGVTALQFRLAQSGGPDALLLESVVLEAAGSGDDTKLAAVKLVQDANSDGVAQPGEIVLASGRFAADNGMLTLSGFASQIQAEGARDYVVCLDLSGEEGWRKTFGMKLLQATASPGVRAIGCPVLGRTVTVTDVTPPRFTLTSPQTGIVLPNVGTVRVGYSVVDEANGSGVAPDDTQLTLDGKPVTNDQVLDLASMFVGPHYFVGAATDRAGNPTALNAMFRTETTQQAMQSVADRLADMIKDPNTPARAVALIQDALDLLTGQANGRSGNGAIALMNSGELIAGMVKIQQAIRKLRDAQDRGADTTELRMELAAFVRDVMTVRVEHLEKLIPGNPALVRIRAYMAAGNAAFAAADYEQALFNYREAEQRILVLDRESPNVVFVEPRGFATNDTTPKVGIQYTDVLTLVNKSGIRVFLDGIDRTSIATIGPFELILDVPPSLQLSEGAHPVRIIVPDIAGNRADQTRNLIVDLVTPRLVTLSPAAGATGVPVAANAVVVFSETMLRPPTLEGFVRLYDAAGTPVLGKVVMADNDTRATFVPAAPLSPGAIYTARVPGSAVTLTDLAGNPLEPPSAVSQFRTLSGNPPPAPVLSRPRDGLKTFDNTITVQGTTGALLRVELFVNANLLATRVADANGVFQFEAPALQDGSYVFTVRVVETGEPPSEFSDDRRVVVDTAAPAAPSGVALIECDGYMDLIWNPNQETDCLGYLVFRKGPRDADFVRVTPLVVSSTAFRDTDVVNGTAYRYRVRAVDDSGPDEP